MFHKLKLNFDGILREVDENNNLHQIRAAIVSKCLISNILTETEKRYINFRPAPLPNGSFPLPNVLFAHPNKGATFIDIFSFDLTLLEKMNRVIDTIVISKKGEFKKIGHKLMKDIAFLPRFAGKKITYKTRTPFIFYDKKGINFFFAAEKMHNEKTFRKILAEDIVKNIKMSIKSQLGFRLNKPVEQFGFVDSINITLKEFNWRWGKYHKDKPYTPKIVAEFESDWELPIFLGHHTGKGYGHIIKV